MVNESQLIYQPLHDPQAGVVVATCIHNKQCHKQESLDSSVQRYEMQLGA
jgi:hypothetical protein